MAIHELVASIGSNGLRLTLCQAILRFRGVDGKIWTNISRSTRMRSTGKSKRPIGNAHWWV